MIPEQFAYIAIITSLAGASFYIRDIFLGKTRPNFVSWFMWMLAPFVGVFLQIQAGAGFIYTLPVFMAGFVPFLVLIAALIKKNAYWKITFFDIACGIFSILALFLWISTKNTTLSVIFAILADGLAVVPTLVKSWKAPETETGITYLSGIINNTIGLFIINSWVFSIYSLYIYFIIANLSIVLCIYRKKILSMIHYKYEK
ncbi:MAG TPA: hypothetical protein VJH06_03895 [Candidatus Paceibacterota bacterium]